jgi:hypothetical protein
MTDVLKLWAVVWTSKGMEEYGVKRKEDQIILVEPKEEIAVNEIET